MVIYSSFKAPSWISAHHERSNPPVFTTGACYLARAREISPISDIHVAEAVGNQVLMVPKNTSTPVPGLVVLSMQVEV